MRPSLITQYSEARLPRYTSYPTAPHFSATTGATDYAEWLAETPAATLTSLYVHVPFCRRMCWYCGCNTAVTLRDEPILAYGEMLKAEIALVGRYLGDRLPVAHVHFGGGTPTIMAPERFLELMETLRAAFDVRADAEIAIEIDPRTLDREMVAALAAAGVNRASLGVQSLDPAVQRAINRTQTFQETEAVVGWLRAAGIVGINIDLIYGLPHQTVASALETVDRCLTLAPDRIAVFGYAHVPAFKHHQRKIDTATLPRGSERNLQAEAIGGAMVAAGYRPIGIDHYARAGDSMAVAAEAGRLHRNFQGYTADPADVLIAFGASAIGRLRQGYVQNEPTVRAYSAAIGAGRLAIVKGCALNDDDRLRGEIIERLMCDFRVDVAAICRRHGRTTASLADAMENVDRLAADGVIRRHRAIIEVDPEARGLIRAVAASFDAYLAASPRQYSPAL